MHLVGQLDHHLCTCKPLSRIHLDPYLTEPSLTRAQLGTIIGAGLDFPEFVLGYGHRRYFISDPAYSRFTYYSHGEWIQTFATLMWTKVSISLFLYRIPVTKALKRPLQIIVVLLVVSNLILTLLWILQCLPVSAVWDEEERKTAKCFSKEQLLQIILAQGIISAISDFVLAAYPGLILTRLQMSIRKKVGPWLLMGLGCVTGVCCVVCNVLNWTNESQDSTWDSIPNWMWRCLEVNFGIAAACLPALYPGYKAAQKKLASIKSSRRSSGSSKKGPFTGAPVGKKRPARTHGGNDGRIADLPIPEAAIVKTTGVGLHQSPMRGTRPQNSAESLALLRTVDIRNYGR